MKDYKCIYINNEHICTRELDNNGVLSGYIVLNVVPNKLKIGDAVHLYMDGFRYPCIIKDITNGHHFLSLIN